MSRASAGYESMVQQHAARRVLAPPLARTATPATSSGAGPWLLIGATFVVGLLGVLVADLSGADLAIALPAWLAPALVALGVRRSRPATAEAWLLVAGGRATLFVTGLDANQRLSQGAAVEITLLQLAALAGHGLVIWGLVELARSVTRVWDRTRWIDSATISLSLALAASSVLAVPNVAVGTPWARTWLPPLTPSLDLFALLLAVRCLLAVRQRTASLRLLTLGLLVQFLGSAARRWLAPADLAFLPVPQRTLATATAVAGLLIAGAALHRSVATVAVRVIPWSRIGAVRFAVLVGGLVLPLACLVGLAAAGDAGPSMVAYLATGAAVIGILTLVRVSGLVSYADELADARHRSRFEALADHSHDAVIIVDAYRTVTWASPAVHAVLGHDPDELLGRPLAALVGRQAAEELAEPLHHLEQLATGTTVEIATSMVGLGERRRVIEGVATNLLHDPAVNGLVLVVRDVTDRTELQQQLTRQAFVDPLTGLANRALFGDRVDHALAHVRGGGSRPVAVLFVDLDDFKDVNDTLGHGRGDDLLVAVGRRIADSVGPADTAARLGGDEFGVLLEGADEEQAIAVAERILRLLSVALVVGEFPITVSASIGVAMVDPANPTGSVLLRSADLAMYDAKREGKGCVRVFRSEMHERELRQFTLRSDLQIALDRDEFRLEYQPIVDMATGQVTGSEALLRWQHPVHGLISPLDFIPVAEATRAIVPLGRWVLRTACEQLAAWNDVLGPLTMDVNVSAVQLGDPGFVADVAEVLADSGIDPGRLVLELTESILVHDADAARSVLEQLRGLGVQLAIDDFGTGYSSLAYLQNFPIDIVKIDRAFVVQLGEDGRGRNLARSIVAIASSLGIGTIAEGIETEAQAIDLSTMDCAHGQGFHYSRPVGSDAFELLVLGTTPADPIPADPIPADR